MSEVVEERERGGKGSQGCAGDGSDDERSVERVEIGSSKSDFPSNGSEVTVRDTAADTKVAQTTASMFLYSPSSSFVLPALMTYF